MKITVKIMTTFWPKIWQRQKWSTIYTHQHHVRTVSTFFIITNAFIYVSRFTFSIVYVKLYVFVLSARVLCLPQNSDL